VDVPHNIAFYPSSTSTNQPVSPGAIGLSFPGPGVDDTAFDIPSAGNYFFRCDVHPTTMTGTFTVN
jgi:plastocyanin